MKKSRFLCIFSIVLLAAVLSGCAKEVKVLPPLDKKTAEDECAKLIIPFNANVKRIGDKKRGMFRSWGVGGGWSSKSKAATVLIPAGEYTIITDYSQPLDGWLGKGLETEEPVAMSAGKMYKISVTIDENEKVGTGSPALNMVTSFIRNYVVEILSFLKFLPRSNPEGIVYQIDEIDQEAFDQYLLEPGTPITTGTHVKAFLLSILWVVVAFVVIRALCYFIFMGKLMNSHKFFAVLFAIILVVAGFALINYNTSGLLSLYIVASVLIGIGISGWDFGRDSNKKGVEKLSKNDYAGAVTDFKSAIAVAPYNALYYNNRGVAYTYLQDWNAAIADFTKAVQFRPKNPLYNKNLADTQAQVK